MRGRGRRERDEREGEEGKGGREVKHIIVEPPMRDPLR